MTKKQGLALVVGNTAVGRTVDADIDRLFQLPLDEFTPARNALARERGKDGAAIKALQKPSVPAWAINQLYWRQRSVYDRLVSSSQELRDQHRQILEGTGGSIRDAEKTNREALRDATDAVKTILADENQAATPGTMAAVAETLEALPADEAPGRLTRPLKPLGFEALAGLALRPAADSRTPPAKKPRNSAVTGIAATRDLAAGEREAARREVEAARRAAEQERERQRQARANVRRAEADLARAQEAFDKADRETKRRARELEEARATLERLQRFV